MEKNGINVLPSVEVCDTYIEKASTNLCLVHGDNNLCEGLTSGAVNVTFAPLFFSLIQQVSDKAIKQEEPMVDLSRGEQGEAVVPRDPSKMHLRCSRVGAAAIEVISPLSKKQRRSS